MEGLSPEADANYSLWKATNKFKRPMFRIPPLKNETDSWVYKERDKAELFARHLVRVFKPDNIQTRIEPVISYHDKTKVRLKYTTSREIAQIIDREIKINKAPGMDEITPRILKEMSRKGMVLLTYIYNACLRLVYIPRNFKNNYA